MEHVTFQELNTALKDSREAIISEMRAGFLAVTTRQDQTNGRLLRVEEKVAGHEKMLLHCPVFDAPAPKPTAPSEQSPITRRDVWLVATTVGLLVALLKGLPWLLTIGEATGR